MSLRLEMRQAMRQSLKQLHDSAGLVGDYLRSQISPEGGFCDRSGKGDLYYTVFGLEALIALSEPMPVQIFPYLLSFGLGENLDLVHLCCLIRCRADAGIHASQAELEAWEQRLESYRSTDGGYNTVPFSGAGSAYGCFLAIMAYEDLGLQIPSIDKTLHSLKQLHARDGGFANHPGQDFGITPSTAATATLIQSLGGGFPPGMEAWLLSRCDPNGGFFAVPAAPFPDLLSTATALHALTRMSVSLDALREPCLDFIQSLWTGDGAFLGNWADPVPDCEYTYYGLLALGNLSL